MREEHENHEARASLFLDLLEDAVGLGLEHWLVCLGACLDDAALLVHLEDALADEEEDVLLERVGLLVLLEGLHLRHPLRFLQRLDLEESLAAFVEGLQVVVDLRSGSSALGAVLQEVHASAVVG